MEYNNRNIFLLLVSFQDWAKGLSAPLYINTQLHVSVTVSHPRLCKKYTKLNVELYSKYDKF